MLFFYANYFQNVFPVIVLLQLKKYTIICLLCLLIFTTGCDEPQDAVELVKISPVDGKEMVLIPAGEFIMGTNKIDSDNTQQKIGTVKPLYLDQHPELCIEFGYYLRIPEVRSHPEHLHLILSYHQILIHRHRRRA